MASGLRASREGTRVVRGEAKRVATREWLGGEICAASILWRGSDAELRQHGAFHTFILTTQGGTALTGARLAGEMIYEGADAVGSLSYTPAWVDRHCWYLGAEMKFVGLFVHERVATRLGLEELLGAAAPVVNGSDPVAQALLASLGSDLESDAPLEASYLEQAFGFLAARSARIAPTTELQARTLGRRAIRAVADYVEAHLEGELSVADLAAVAGLSPDRFGRHFKSSTGRTPYQFVLERRVRRAEQLLSDTDLDLASIAARVGFSSHSHMTTTFKKTRGATPAALRAAAGAGLLKAPPGS